MLLAGCGDDDGSADSGSSGDEASGSAGGDLGPTASVRIAQLVPGITFDAWGPGADNEPVRIGEGIGYAAISDYFEAPLNPISEQPIFALLPAGEAPDADSQWLNVPAGPDRARIDFSGLEGEGQRGTLIVTPTEGGDNVQWEQLDETDIVAADPAMVNLHLSNRLGDLGGLGAPSFAVVGEPCLPETSVVLALAVAPGSFEFGAFDEQTVSGCTTTPLAAVAMEGAAGERRLIVAYHEDGVIDFLTADIL